MWAILFRQEASATLQHLPHISHYRKAKGLKPLKVTISRPCLPSFFCKKIFFSFKKEKSGRCLAHRTLCTQRIVYVGPLHGPHLSERYAPASSSEAVVQQYEKCDECSGPREQKKRPPKSKRKIGGNQICTQLSHQDIQVNMCYFNL